MTKRNIWVLVADAARARVFSMASPKGEMTPVWEAQSADSRLSTSEIASDRAGRTFDRAGEGRHAKEPRTDPARYESERFAREVARKLDEGRKRGAFDRLYIVAAPQFLGDLRAMISDPLKACVKKEIDKDLSKLPPAELRAHLGDALRP